MNPRLKRNSVIIGIYLLLALALTYPLALRFATHLPGDGGDDPPLAWNLWWVRYALLNLGANPFDCDYMFYPIGINLAFYTLTVLNGLISIPLQPFLGLVASSNLILLSSFVLGGYGTYLLVLYLLRDGRITIRHQPFAISQMAAFVAGLIYAFSSSKFFYAALGQFNIASSQWIPFYILFLLKMRGEPNRPRHALLAAIFLLFQAWAEMTYASFLIVFTILYLLYSLFEWAWAKLFSQRPGQTAPNPHSEDSPILRRGYPTGFLRNLILLALIFLIGLSPILYMMIPDLLVEGDIFVQGSGFAEVFLADLVGFTVPTQLHPLLGSWVGSLRFPHDKGQHLFIGYTVLALALYAVVRRWRNPSVRFWALSALVFSLLCLGPVLRLNGQATALPLPFLILQKLPFFKGNRYPSRFSAISVLSLAVLVGYGVGDLLSLPNRRKDSPVPRQERNSAPPMVRRHPLLLAACFSLLITFEHLSIPLPMSDMRVPEVYRVIAAEEGDFTLLDIPLAWRNGFRITGTLDTIISFEQFYQTVHRQPILAGNTSRNPEFKFRYFTESPVINHIIALETGHEVEAKARERDKALAADVLRFFNVRYIVVHPQAGPEVAPYLKETLEPALPLEKIYEGNGLLAYRVTPPPPPDEVIIHPAEEMARLYLGEGWSRPIAEGADGGYIWAQRKEVRLFVPLKAQKQRMAWRAFSPGEGQSLTIAVNGHALPSLALSRGWGQYEVEIPARYLKEGLNEIRLHFSRLFLLGEAREEARRAGMGSYAIGRTGIASPVDILVESAGEEVGDFGHIYVNGRNVSQEGRGYNLAVIDPAGGAVEAVASFDTHLNEKASREIAAFLAAIPEGKIVAVAVADEASRLLGEEAVQALESIGARGNLRGKFRWSQAIIGVKGTGKGQALEGLDPIRPVGVHVGQAVSKPHLAAAFSSIRFQAMFREDLGFRKVLSGSLKRRPALLSHCSPA